METPVLDCRDSQRRQVLRDANRAAGLNDRTWNGIDYVELDASAGNLRCLRVEFLCGRPALIDPNQFQLRSHLQGELVRLSNCAPCPCGTNAVLLCTEKDLCESASYTLTILRKPNDIDPRFASYSFTAIRDGATDVDPKPQNDCPPAMYAEPQLNYLARDYASFRQLLLDRLAVSMPAWRERHIPDLGLALVEMFAYVGDYLAWQQDAVATEAYLQTARQRISVRRHARLVDYQLHEGCNARTFVCLEVSDETLLYPEDVYFTTGIPDDRLDSQTVVAHFDLERFAPGSFQGFEIVRPAPRCRGILCTDITNTVGLIGQLLDRNGTLENFLVQNFPADLVQAIVEYAATADGPPPAPLVERLAAALDDLVRQHVLWQVRLVLARNTFVEPMPSLLALLGAQILSTQTVDSNIELIRSQFRGLLARTRGTPLRFVPAQNSIRFYTWNQSECCLRVGATRATLLDGRCTQLACAESAVEYDPPAAAGTSSPPASDPCCRNPQDPPTEIGPCVPHPFYPASSLCSPYVRAYRDHWQLKDLAPGDLLLLEERLGPKTHNEADADPVHRQVVRLTKVSFCIDPVAGYRLVEIEWGAEDALQFPLCISSIGPAPQCALRDDVSIARGNVLLVDHGVTTDAAEWLNYVRPVKTAPTCDDGFCKTELPTDPLRAQPFRPSLAESDLTYAAPADDCAPASRLRRPDPHLAVPAIRVYGFPLREIPADAVYGPTAQPPTIVALADLRDPAALIGRLNQLTDREARRLEAMFPPAIAGILQSTRAAALRGQAPVQTITAEQLESVRTGLNAGVSWGARQHLLDAEPSDQAFVVEVDNERLAQLRFGDDDLGRRPPVGTSFYASYRRGNGVSGNVGSGKIKHLVYRRTFPSGRITSLGNPLPAQGGCEPESLEHAKQHAPHAFRKLNRAIIADDYATLVRRDFAGRVQQARATLTWMGMCYEVAVAIDPRGEERNPRTLVREVEQYLQKYRRIGHLLRVDLPCYVALTIEMTVCVSAGYLRAHVQRELLQRFSNRILPDGTRGFFHPDNFGFGDSLYLSRLISEAKKVAGVENVDVTRFERRGQGDQGELEAGVVTFAPLEIPRLDSDPMHPESGCFCLNMQGAR